MEADYVIVGGGSAGCVLANRLSADPNTHVVLLEAGPDASPLQMQIPLLYNTNLENQRLGWNFMSENDASAADRAIRLKRGRVLGGSSSVNAMAFTRGHPADFDRWKQDGLADWGYADVLPYFRKLETSWRGPSQVHGGDGPMTVSRSEYDPDLHERFRQAAIELDWPINDDFDGNGADGYGCYDTTTANGRRASAARRYLDPVRRRRNLTIIPDATVTRLRIENGAATGIDYLRDDQAMSIIARREVILSAGTYGSPHLLMLSGIGDGEELGRHGIAVKVDLPGVGRNLQEHPSVPTMFASNRLSRFDQAMRVDRLGREFLNWRLRGKGRFTGIPLAGVAFFRSEETLDVPDLEVVLLTTGLDARPWIPMLHPPRGKKLLNMLWMLHPLSRGTVRLRSSDPRAAPAIQHNMLGDPHDVAALVKGLRKLRALFGASAMSDLVEKEVIPGAAVQSDAELEAFVRNTVMAGAHPVGTCPMGVGPQSVCGPDLRVRGVRRLRVVDASVMPTVVTGHTNAATLMIAERASDLILSRASAA